MCQQACEMREDVPILTSALSPTWAQVLAALGVESRAVMARVQYGVGRPGGGPRAAAHADAHCPGVHPPGSAVRFPVSKRVEGGIHLSGGVPQMRCPPPGWCGRSSCCT